MGSDTSRRAITEATLTAAMFRVEAIEKKYKAALEVWADEMAQMDDSNWRERVEAFRNFLIVEISEFERARRYSVLN